MILPTSGKNQFLPAKTIFAGAVFFHGKIVFSIQRQKLADLATAIAATMESLVTDIVTDVLIRFLLSLNVQKATLLS